MEDKKKKLADIRGKHTCKLEKPNRIFKIYHQTRQCDCSRRTLINKWNQPKIFQMESTRKFSDCIYYSIFHITKFKNQTKLYISQ